MGYLYFLVSILAETVATTALEAADGSTRLAPSLVVVAGYAVALRFPLAHPAHEPRGRRLRLWSGGGIVLISPPGWLVHGQSLDAPALVGMALIPTGVLTIHAFPGTAQH